MTELSCLLLDWYNQHKRNLPWRTTHDPYRVWVSEIMLQQTRVDTVIPYYLRFMEAFPNIKVLSEAKEERYLKLWEGLGYYSRVRNLVKGAKLIQEQFKGVMPEDKESLLKIPGIGDYTSAAILSFAYGEPVVTIDGNLIRVYARLTASKIIPNETQSKKDAEAFLMKHIPNDRSGDFNQALMDLGELVCLPNGAPRCNECPLKDQCKAHLEKKETSYPLPKKKIEKKIEERSIFMLICDKKIALFKRPSGGLLGGMYEFLNIENKEGISPEKLLQNLNISCKNPIFLGEKKHVFTHLVWKMKGYICYVDSFPMGSVIADKEALLYHYTIPTAYSYFLEAILKRAIL